MRDGDHYRVSGRKLWTTTAQTANKILLIARTTPFEECEANRRADPFTPTLIGPNRSTIDRQNGTQAVDSNALFIDDLLVPIGDRIGEGDGWKCLLHGESRAYFDAAEAVGLGQVALERAARYAVSESCLIGPLERADIQHPLAENWMELQAAELMVFKASLYDQGKACGEANASKSLAASAAHKLANERC